MDGRTRYKKISEMLKPLVGQKMELYRLKNRVRIIIGSSDSVVVETIRLMIDLNLIREVENLVFLVERYEADL